MGLHRGLVVVRSDCRLFGSFHCNNSLKLFIYSLVNMTVQLVTQMTCMRGVRAGPSRINQTNDGSTRATRGARSAVITKAALDSSSTYAIAQQAVAFAAVAGAEAAYTGLNGREGTPGLPQKTPTLIGCGGSVASAILVSVSPAVAIAGCLAGLGSSGYMLYTYVQRFKDTPMRPEDWPGAKSWPAVMCLITFFIFMAYFQGVRQSFS
jgi:hypothetical protein